jgi:hypothetical protein
MAVQIAFGSVWQQFASEHASDVVVRLSQMSRNPFVWHNVIQALMHASTWPGTALAYRQLLGAILLGETPGNVSCDSSCEFCGSDSVFQSTMNALHTGINYPRLSSASSVSAAPKEYFLPKYIEFLLDVALSRTSPYRHQFGEILGAWKRSRSQNTCPISLAPTLVEVFSSQDDSAYFFGKLKLFFGTPNTEQKKRTAVPSVSSFFLLTLAKMYEGATVESGRNFDAILFACVSKFANSLPPSVEVHMISPVSSPRFGLLRPQQCATSLVQIIRHSLVSMFLPPTEWTSLVAPNSVEQMVKSEKLERCTQFMEPSAVVSVIRHMLTRPEAIPNLSGNNEGKFNYVISKVKVVKFDIDRCVCLLKSLKTSSPAGTPGPIIPASSQGAKLALIVKEVNVQVEHEWRIEWNAKRYGTYYGTNTVKVRGLSSQVNLTVFPDDQGPVVDSAMLSLGHVEHSCSILNSNFISEMVAQAALDWFAEPLTRLIQTASQTALDQFLKSAAIDFRLKIWNASILKLVPQEVLAELVAVLNDHLPRQGVPI